MNNNSEHRSRLALFLSEKIGKKVEEIESWLKEYEFSQNISPNKKKERKSAADSSKGSSKSFAYPPETKEKGRQKIPIETYESLDPKLKESICNRTIKSAGEMFVCGAFPITEDNRCHRCLGTKKTTVEKIPKIDTSTLNTGLGKKLHIRLFSTNFPDIYSSNSFKIEDIIFEHKKAIGYLKDTKCEIEKTGEVFQLPNDWKENLLPLDDQRKKYLDRFLDVEY